MVDRIHKQQGEQNSMKKRKWMLLLQAAAVLALATGLAAPVQAAELDTSRGASLTISLAEDDTTDVQKSFVADLYRGGVKEIPVELYRVAVYNADGTLTSEPDFVALELETVVEQAQAAYEKQKQEAAAAATPVPSETPAEPTPEPTPDTGRIPGSIWQHLWEEKAQQAAALVKQNKLPPTASLQMHYETCTDTTARYTGTVTNLVCGMYLVRLPSLDGAAYRYAAQDYLVSVPYNASLDASAPQTQPDVWEYEVTSYPKLDRRNYPAPGPNPTPSPTPLPVEDEPAPTPTGSPGLWRLPQTGDTAQPLLWLAVMLVAGAGLVLVLIKKHKSNGGNEK